jgi:uncharacterized membrane protein (UPF0127 family)
MAVTIPFVSGRYVSDMYAILTPPMVAHRGFPRGSESEYAHTLGDHRAGRTARTVRKAVQLALACVLVLVLAAGTGCKAGAPSVSAESVRVTLGGVEVLCAVADDRAERSLGLQGRESLAAGEGMLFVFDGVTERTFAMKDVSFPIDVVFVGTDMLISAIEPLDPGDTRLVTSPGPCPYVVELSQGWAADQGIAIGDALVVIR